MAPWRRVLLTSVALFVILVAAAPVHASDPRLTATFFGTTTLALSDGRSTVMIDGFFSRPPLPAMLFTRLSPNEKRIDKALARGKVGELCGVFVAHGHYDHGLDAAAVAARGKATLLFGSASALRIANAQGFPPARTRLIAPSGGRFACGSFEVTAIPSPHSPDARYPGEVDAAFRSPAPMSDYRLGDSYAFVLRHGDRRFVVHPSANVRPGMYAGLRAETVFLGVGELAGQSSTAFDTYWRETIGVLRPRVVVPIHWDNFSWSLEHPLRPTPALVDDSRAALAGVKTQAGTSVMVHIPQAFEVIDLDAPP